MDEAKERRLKAKAEELGEGLAALREKVERLKAAIEKLEATSFTPSKSAKTRPELAPPALFQPIFFTCEPEDSPLFP